MSAFTKVSFPLVQILEDTRQNAQNSIDFEVAQAAQCCVNYLTIGEQLEYLQQMEASYAQTLDYTKPVVGQEEQAGAKLDDLMAKYLVCKSLPGIILRLLLNYHGSPLINLNMQAESDYFALKDISK